MNSRTIKHSSVTALVLCLVFNLGCTAAGDEMDASPSAAHPEMEDPFPSVTFDFTQEIAQVPDEESQEADQRGSVARFYYTTKNYDGDQSDEIKYAEVYTPYQYNSMRAYNILYLMHGYTGSADDWLGTPEDPSDIKNCIDHLIEDGAMEPMIVVALTYYDNNTDEETDNYDINLTKAFSTEFITDVMPSVESTYHTYAETIDEAGLTASRSHRAFGGFSMGGVTTWYQFCNSLKYVSIFYPASGSLYWGPDVDGKDQSFGGRFALDAMQAQGYTKNDFFLYLTTGSEDYARSIVEAQVSSMLLQPDTFTFGDPDQAGVNCSYGISDGEEHDYHGRLRDIYTILPILSQKMGQ